MTPGLGLRLSRAAVFAAVCVVASALGHALMSGQTVPVWVAAYAFAATTVGAWWLTGRERGALVVTGSAVAAQFVLHTAFSLSQSPTASAMSAPMAAHDGMGGMGRMGGVSGSVGMAATGHSWSLGMGLAHCLAALICGLWLWCGEAAAFRLGRSLASSVFAPLRRARRSFAYAGLASPTRPGAAYGPVLRLCAWPLRYAVLRRGPPVLPVCR
ncbi:hypothetical protein [Streptomyces noursei]|uniref:Integral membrane protein n=1 Tax=Streptomyces noursei TaxID=1971 RepID=A0A2N8PJC5_STRNR|nr:hypothetical protein [Streptomyces noursei]PNE41111.1 hypothetical protein AOB60_10335 [Streptomyces noursei]